MLCHLRGPRDQRTEVPDGSCPVSVTLQVNNINQPLEITAISSPESSLKSSPVPYQDNDQPPVLKKEKPLSQTNGAHYSPLTSDEEPGSEDEPGSARCGGVGTALRAGVHRQGSEGQAPRSGVSSGDRPPAHALSWWAQVSNSQLLPLRVTPLGAPVSGTTRRVLLCQAHATEPSVLRVHPRFRRCLWGCRVGGSRVCPSSPVDAWVASSDSSCASCCCEHSRDVFVCLHQPHTGRWACGSRVNSVSCFEQRRPISHSGRPVVGSRQPRTLAGSRPPVLFSDVTSVLGGGQRFRRPEEPCC